MVKNGCHTLVPKVQPAVQAARQSPAPAGNHVRAPELRAEIDAALQEYLGQLEHRLNGRITDVQSRLEEILWSSAGPGQSPPFSRTTSHATLNPAAPTAQASGGSLQAPDSASRVQKKLRRMEGGRSPSRDRSFNRAHSWLRKNTSDRALGAMRQARAKYPPPRPSSWFYRLVHHSAFEGASFVLIIVNAIFIGWEVQHMAYEPSMKVPFVFEALRIVFIVLYTLELGLRFGALRSSFFTSKDVGLNIFDLVLVLTSVAEYVLEFILKRTHEHNIVMFRIAHLLRVMRIIRVLRVLRIFPELRFLLRSIYGTLKQVFWTLILVLLIMYVVAVALTQGVLDFEVSIGEKQPELTDLYGYLERSFYTLLLVYSQGENWGELAAPLFQVSYFYVALFVLYIFFMLFVVINIMTAIFVESAVECGQRDTDWVIRIQTAQEDSFLREIRRIFKKPDLNDQMITLAELEDQFDDDDVRLRLKVLGVDVSEACSLFRLLDDTGEGAIDCDEFALGCLRLRGQARNIDIQTIRYENRKLLQIISSIDYRFAEMSVRLEAGHELRTSNSFESEGGTQTGSSSPGCLAGTCRRLPWLASSFYQV